MILRKAIKTVFWCCFAVLFAIAVYWNLDNYFRDDPVEALTKQVKEIADVPSDWLAVFGAPKYVFRGLEIIENSEDLRLPTDADRFTFRIGDEPGVSFIVNVCFERSVELGSCEIPGTRGDLPIEEQEKRELAGTWPVKVFPINHRVKDETVLRVAVQCNSSNCTDERLAELQQQWGQ